MKVKAHGKSKQAESTAKQPRTPPRRTKPSRRPPTPRSAGMSEPILKAEHLGITFGGLKAVSDFNMTINSGELVGLIGPNAPAKPPCSTC